MSVQELREAAVLYGRVHAEASPRRTSHEAVNYPPGVNPRDIDRLSECEHGRSPDDCRKCDAALAELCTKCSARVPRDRQIHMSLPPFGYDTSLDWYVCADCAAEDACSE